MSFSAETMIVSVVTLIVGGILSFLISRYYFKRSQSKKEISWTWGYGKIANVDSGFKDRISIQLDGFPLNNPTYIEIAIWNSGNDTISRENIAESAPLTLGISSGKILDYSLHSTINASNNITITLKGEDSLSVDFEYMDPDEGLCIRAIADIDAPIRNKISLSGTIKNKGKIHSAEIEIDGKRDIKSITIHAITVIALGAITALFAINTYISFDLYRVSTFSDVASTLVFFIALIIAGITLVRFRDETVRIIPAGLGVSDIWYSREIRRIPVSLERADAGEITVAAVKGHSAED